ncbi:DUF4900 domain-containing protein [Gracilimonas mengyeensis]|uniref:DUF4900 domain-containing protein n=1 Tax=Gracilimonas mengyeensis TaxID=1302730 RepID=A0A521EDQ6_9BACT|nr:DUF4900 domain-containing protein [Gracilimonas mengyeensis]SMO82066.1 protein of unknown function [Gracilimonas mengyeensis]
MGRALLFLSGGMMILFGIVQLSITERQKIIPERTAEYYTDQQAKNIAASIIDLTIEQIRENQDWVGGFDFDNYMDAEVSVEVYDENSNSYPDSINAGTWDEYKVLLFSEVNYEGTTLETEVLLQRDSFSKYSYFTDAESMPNGQTIWFGGNDAITGPVHTNGTFSIRDSPIFNGPVTSPNMWNRLNSSTNPQFNDQTDFNAPTKELPDASQIDVLESAAHSSGLTFDDDVELEFFVNENEGTNGVGYVKAEQTGWVRCSHSWHNYWEQRTTEEDYKISDYNGLISVDGNVDVKGTVKGEVTLHSSGDVNITGDLMYYVNPDADPSADPHDPESNYYLGLLGLVSEEDVTVDSEAHRDNGSYDIHIHAAIMALGDSFTVENYNDNRSRGTLNVLGGIIQKVRGPVGLTNGSGYTKNYVYDRRLLSMIPPSYPREKWFSVVYWRDRTN